MAACAQPQAIYVVRHGWHTSIVVERSDLVERIPALARDFSSGRYLEIGWGDERFYRAQSPTLAMGIRAIFWPSSAVLHIVSVPETPRRYFAGGEILELTVPGSGYRELLSHVVASFRRPSGDEVIKLGPGLYGYSWFYRANGVFYALNTCNTWVAQSIETTGYPISSATTITAKGVLSQLHSGMHTETQCYSVR